MGCDGLMITPKESSPHMHLKKKKKEGEKKKGMIPFSRGPNTDSFLS